LLTGDGGDDVFFGYPFFRNAWLAQRAALRLPDAAAPLWRATRPLIPAFGPLKRMRSFLDFATEGLRGHAQAHDGLPYYEQRGILGDRFRGAVLTQRMLEPSMHSARRLLFDVFAYHRKMHFTSEFMPKVDGATMYYGLEARSPFLDQEIWEFAATLSPEVRFQNGALKAVLREIARRRLGPAAAERPKQGFSVPVERWLAERWGGALQQLKEGTLLAQGGWVEPGALSRAIDDALASKSVPTQLWYVLVLEKWLNRQRTVVERVPDPPLVLAGREPAPRS
jgi:asparagine synthase (glutamine-hydrolysing)